MTLILNIKRNYFSTGRKSTRNSRCGKMMILPTIYEDPPTAIRFTTMTDHLERSEAYMRKTKRKIDQATMNKCLRTSIRLNTNDARFSTKIPVQNLQQSPPKRSLFQSYHDRKEDAQTKKRLAEFKLSSPLTTSQSKTQEDYTIALQKAFQNFKRRTKHQSWKPPSTVATSQDTPALYFVVPEHQKPADTTHDDDNQTTAKTIVDTNNREAPASSNTPEQKTLSTTTVHSKELDCIHCAREREDHYHTIPSNQAIAKETSTAVEALSREFRNYQNQKQPTFPFRNPMKTPVMHQSPLKSNEPQAAPQSAKFSIQMENASSLSPINMIVQSICTRPPSKPSSPLMPSSSPLLLKAMTANAMTHAINFQSIGMMTPPSTPHLPRKAFQNFKRRTEHQSLKPPSTVAPSQDTPALYFVVPEHQKPADTTHDDDNQTTAKTIVDTNNREAPASSNTPEQKTLSTTTVHSKELDCIHCAREREDHYHTIPSNQAIAKETSTAVEALSREFRNYQNQKQPTFPFRNPMKTPVMHQSPLKSNEPQAAPRSAKFSIQTENASSLPPINMIVQSICTRPPSKPSSPLLPSSSPLLLKAMTPNAMTHAINFQSISMMTPPSTPHLPLFLISSQLLPQAMQPAAMKQDPSNACAITIAGAKNEFSTVNETALACKYGKNALLHQSSICYSLPLVLTAYRPTFCANPVPYEPIPLPLPRKPGGAQIYGTPCLHPIIRCLSS